MSIISDKTFILPNQILIPVDAFITRVYVYAIHAYAEELPVLRVRYSLVFVRIARVCVYAIRAYADE